MLGKNIVKELKGLILHDMWMNFINEYLKEEKATSPN